MKYFPYDNTLISKDLGHKLAGKHKVFSYVSVTRQLVISGEGRLLPFPVWIVEKVPHTEGRRLRSEDEQRWLLSLWSISQWRQGALNSSTSKCCASLAKWPTREGDRRKDRERGERERLQCEQDGERQLHAPLLLQLVTNVCCFWLRFAVVAAAAAVFYTGFPAFFQPTGQTGFWLMAKFATFSRCCSCCCKILFKPSGKRCLHMTSECCLRRPGKETQTRRAADFKLKAKTKTNNNNNNKKQETNDNQIKRRLTASIGSHSLHFIICTIILTRWYYILLVDIYASILVFQFMLSLSLSLSFSLPV